MKSISCKLCLPRGSAYRGRSTDKAKLICKSFSIRRRDRRSLPNRYTECSSLSRKSRISTRGGRTNASQIHPSGEEVVEFEKKTIRTRDLRVGYREMNKIASSDAATASISDPYLARFPSYPFQPLPFQYSAYFSLLTQSCRGRGASRRPGYRARMHASFSKRVQCKREEEEEEEEEKEKEEERNRESQVVFSG